MDRRRVWTGEAQGWLIFFQTDIFNIALSCQFLITELLAVVLSIGIQCGVSKGVEDGRRLPALQTGQS
jgi:hypothetical protein